MKENEATQQPNEVKEKGAFQLVCEFLMKRIDCDMYDNGKLIKRFGEVITFE